MESNGFLEYQHGFFAATELEILQNKPPTSPSSVPRQVDYVLKTGILVDVPSTWTLQRHLILCHTIDCFSS